MGKAAESPSTINSYQAENPLSKLYQERIGPGVEKLMGQLKTRIVLISSDRQVVYQNYAARSMQTATPLGLTLTRKT